MKKFLFIAIILFTTLTGFSQINISTGVASWKVTPTGAAANAIAPHPIWNSQQATPIPGSNARWISPTNSFNAKAGVYVFETIIPVTGNPATLNLNFQVAGDDIIEALEIERPGGTGTIALGVPPPSTPKVYTLRKATDTTIKCPQRGEWKLKARVKYLDAVGGFILSGYAKAEGSCCDCPVPNTNVNFSLTTTLGGGTTATVSALGTSTSLGNGWTLKQVNCTGNKECKWMPGGIKWQSTGSTITIPATVLTPGCYVLTHYMNRCSKKWDPKACLSYKAICFTVCDNSIRTGGETNPKLLQKIPGNNNNATDATEKEAELIKEENQ